MLKVMQSKLNNSDDRVARRGPSLEMYYRHWFASESSQTNDCRKNVQDQA